MLCCAGISCSIKRIARHGGIEDDLVFIVRLFVFFITFYCSEVVHIQWFPRYSAHYLSPCCLIVVRLNVWSFLPPPSFFEYPRLRAHSTLCVRQWLCAFGSLFYSYCFNHFRCIGYCAPIPFTCGFDSHDHVFVLSMPVVQVTVQRTGCNTLMLSSSFPMKVV